MIGVVNLSWKCLKNGFCVHKIKLEASYAHNRVVVGVEEQSGLEPKFGSRLHSHKPSLCT